MKFFAASLIVVFAVASASAHSRLEYPLASSPITHDTKFVCDGIYDQNYYGVHWKKEKNQELMIRIQKEHIPEISLRIIDFDLFKTLHGPNSELETPQYKWEEIAQASLPLKLAETGEDLLDYSYHRFEKVSNISQVGDITKMKTGSEGVYKLSVSIPEDVNCQKCVVILRQNHASKGYYSCATIGLSN